MDDSFRGMLRTYRIAAGLTQEALATRALLSEQAVGALERGERRFPRRDTVARIADALGLDGDARVEFVAAAPSRGGPRPAEPVGRVPRETARGHVRVHRPRRRARDARPAARLGRGRRRVRHGRRRQDRARRALGAPGRDRFPDGQLYVDLRGYDPDQPLTPTADALDRVPARARRRRRGDPARRRPSARAGYRTLLAERRMLVVLDNARDCRPGPRPAARRADLPRGRHQPGRPRRAGRAARRAPRRRSTRCRRRGARRCCASTSDARVDAEPRAGGRAGRRSARGCRWRCGSPPSSPRPARRRRLADARRRAGATSGDRLDAARRGGDPHGCGRAPCSPGPTATCPPTRPALFRLLGAAPRPDVDAYAAAALARRRRSAPARRAARDAGPRAPVDATSATAGTTCTTCCAPTPGRSPARQRRTPRSPAGTTTTSRRVRPRWNGSRRSTGTCGPPPAGAAQVPRFADRAAALAWLDAERANLVALGAHGADHGRATHTGLLSRLLYRYLIIGAHYADAEHLHRAAVRVAAPPHRAEALTSHAIALWRLGRVDEALALYDLALAAVCATDDRMGEGRVLVNRGVTYRWLGRYDEAAEHHRQARSRSSSRPGTGGARRAPGTTSGSSTTRSAGTPTRWSSRNGRSSCTGRWATRTARPACGAVWA